MANHKRQQIREALVSALTGLTTTGANVFEHRLHPIGQAALPCLVVNTDGEGISGDGFNGGQRRQVRELTCTVKGYAKLSANIDDKLDTIAKEVEVAIAAAGTLGGLAAGGVQLRGIDVELDGSGDTSAGVVVMDFVATYLTMEGAPDA